MNSKYSNLVSGIAWVIALGLVAVAVFLTAGRLIGDQYTRQPPALAQAFSATLTPPSPADQIADLPEIRVESDQGSLDRHSTLHTIIPNRPQQDVRSYNVNLGDSVFEIANKFQIKPETVLWANYDQLNDNPDLISVDMVLNVPPVDGVYYEWQAGDTIESVVARFAASAEDILSWPGNQLDLTNPEVEPGTWIMIPDGHREFRQWIIPAIPRGRAGVSQSLYGAGACSGSYDGAYGSGGFIWPAGNHYLSGNDYWSGHLAIDIGAGEGAPIYAADSGVVVFAGWATGGYGNMVMIDHGNGYQSLYAHMSSVSTSCGRSVNQGQILGYSGSTGNSTGAHLHFEIRYQGGFVNPWFVLPAP